MSWMRFGGGAMERSVAGVCVAIGLFGLAGCFGGETSPLSGTDRMRGAARPVLEWRVARAADDLIERAGLEPLEWRRCPIDRDQPQRILNGGADGPEQAYWVSETATFRADSGPEALRLSVLPSTGSRSATDAAPERVAVRGRFPETVHRSLARARERFRTCTLLLSVQGKPEWADPNGSTWSEWIPLGVFESGDPTFERLLVDEGGLEIPAEWVAWPEATDALAATAESRERALRRLACEAGFRAAFEADHPGATAELLEGWKDIDCGDSAGD